jgi:hypothetical protein
MLASVGIPVLESTSANRGVTPASSAVFAGVAQEIEGRITSASRALAPTDVRAAE